MDKVDETSEDVNNLYNLTTSLATSLSYHQLVLYIRSVLANLQDSLSYIRTVSTHTMDYIDAATTGTLSPHILPIMDPQKMLAHIEETLPSTLHLSVLSEDTLHFCRYLHTRFDHQQAIPMSYRCTSSGLITTTFHLQNFHFKIFPMVISQLAMISVLNISALLKMKQCQWKSHHNSLGFVKKQMDNFVPFLHHSNHLLTHHLALQLCMSRIQLVSLPDVHYRLEKAQMSVCLLNLHHMFGFSQQHPQQ